MTERTWNVEQNEAGVTLDKFLAAPDRLGSRSKAATARERGKVFVNGAEVGHKDVRFRLKAGDEIRVWQDRPGSARRRSTPFKSGPLRILYEDQYLIVLDKPAGLLAVPLERRGEEESIFDQIEDHFRSHGKRKPLVVHRIDRDTSGVVVFAKDPRAYAALKQQFRERTPDRVYLAVVYGHPTPPSGTWRDHLVWDGKALIQKETHPNDPRAAEAISQYKVMESFETTSLVEVRLTTGKRNQIRIQARLRGHTLVGEVRYTFGPDELRPIPFKRQALHAWRLTFHHPVEQKPMTFEAPVPSDIKTLLAHLRHPTPSTPRLSRLPDSPDSPTLPTPRLFLRHVSCKLSGKARSTYARASETEPPMKSMYKPNISSTARLASTVAGAALAVVGYQRSNKALGLLGLGLVARGASGWCPVTAAVDPDAQYDNEQTKRHLGGSHGVIVDDAITIYRPVSEVYSYWRNLENLPRFMEHLEEVRTTDRLHSHWVARGPLGVLVEWDAEIINDIPPTLLSWKSIGYSDVISAGSIRFKPAGEHATQVHVKLQYDPPAGKLGATVAWLFGEDPQHQIAEDLRRFKQLLETGEVSTTAYRASASSQRMRRGLDSSEFAGDSGSLR